MQPDGWQWIAFMFAITWTSTAATGLQAKRTSIGVRGDTMEHEETFRHLQEVGKDARRGSGPAAKLAEQIKQAMATDPLHRGYVSHLNHPVHRCRAILAPHLLDASILAINEIVRRLRMAPARSGLNRPLPKAKALAWGQYQQALKADVDLGGAKDAQVYAYFKEYLKETNDQLASKESWCKYVSDARRHYGEQKWIKGTTKSSSSMVRQSGQATDD
jgi:hypothetical protein